MKTDIEIDDMKTNMILIGGPIINKITRKKVTRLFITIFKKISASKTKV